MPVFLGNWAIVHYNRKYLFGNANEPSQSSLFWVPWMGIHSVKKSIILIKHLEYKSVLITKFLKIIFFCVWVFLPVCVSVFVEARRGYQVPWNWNYGWLWAAMWVLRTQIQVFCKNKCSLSLNLLLSSHTEFFKGYCQSTKYRKVWKTQMKGN